MSFAEALEAATAWAAANLPIAAGGAVSVAVLTFLCVNAAARRRREPDPDALDPAKLEKAFHVAVEKALNWEPPEASYADRRRAVRREGRPVPVVLAAPTFRSGACDGYVIDRSTGGLKVAAPFAVAVGSTLQVRAADAPGTVGFVTAIVRSCRRADGHYEIGCEFDSPPPWSVLLLFG